MPQAGRLLLAGAITGCDHATVSAFSQDESFRGEANSAWHRTLADTTILGDVVVPDGEAWLIGPGVRIEGNLRTVGGTVGMRPGSTLHFLGADPDEYVGGGMEYNPEYDRDIGLWIGSQGTLDIQCTPKAAWNRTGSSPSWLPTDEYWIAPTAPGDFRPRRWEPGDEIPQADPRVPAAEILNVTRDCTIRGPAHIHIHSQKPQRIEYVRLEGMGISNRAHGGPVLGRYALHIHMSGSGSRGTLIKGVAAVGSPGRVFVPHGSHGITMEDNVSVNSYAEGLWWDEGHETDDLLVDRMAVVGVEMPTSVSGRTNRFDGYTLGVGNNMSIRNSVAAGVCCNKLTVGFDWPEPTPAFDKSSNFVWTFSGNVAHNNEGPGVRFWTNLLHPHLVENYVSYRNGVGGAENGAYVNGIEYRNVTMVEEGQLTSDRSADRAGLVWNANARLNSQGRPSQISDCEIVSRVGPALKITHRQLPGTSYMLVVDCRLESAPGEPKVYVSEGQNPWKARFVRSGVTPEDIVFAESEGNEGSHVLIENEDGTGWEISVQNGRKVVRPRQDE